MHFIFSFVDDWVTRAAAIWQSTTSSFSSHTYAYNTAATGAGAITTIASTILRDLGSSGLIGGIEFTGHGLPGDIYNRLSLKDLLDPSSQQVSALRQLQARWARQNKGVILRHCYCAAGQQGHQFLALFSQAIGAKVYAWDQAYEIVPTGVQYVGLPNGTTILSYDTHRREVLGPSGFDPQLNPWHPIENARGNVRAAWTLIYNTGHYLWHGK
jgi:hypothetical protein